jgi:hypothetical protein
MAFLPQGCCATERGIKSLYFVTAWGSLRPRSCASQSSVHIKCPHRARAVNSRRKRFPSKIKSCLLFSGTSQVSISPLPLKAKGRTHEHAPVHFHWQPFLLPNVDHLGPSYRERGLKPFLFIDIGRSAKFGTFGPLKFNRGSKMGI